MSWQIPIYKCVLRCGVWHIHEVASEDVDNWRASRHDMLAKSALDSFDEIIDGDPVVFVRDIQQLKDLFGRDIFISRL